MAECIDLPLLSNYLLSDCLCLTTNCFRQKQQLYTMSSTSDILIISGYLRFAYGDTRQNIVLESVNNGLPQPTRLLSTRLVSSTGLTPVTPSISGLSTLNGELFIQLTTFQLFNKVIRIFLNFSALFFDMVASTRPNLSCAIYTQPRNVLGSIQLGSLTDCSLLARSGRLVHSAG